MTLPTGGELKAVGKRPTELEADLLKVYGPQLQFKEVVIALESSAFPVFVTGAVLRPGRIMSDRPITALEAIMEAGGFDYTKANLKAVVIVRREEGQVRNFKLNLKLPLEGKPSEPFYLNPSDIVYINERFSFFCERAIRLVGLPTTAGAEHSGSTTITNKKGLFPQVCTSTGYSIRARNVFLRPEQGTVILCRKDLRFRQRAWNSRK